jgi:alanine racemase
LKFYVFNTERLDSIIQQAKKLNIRAKIHLEAETGMNRSGLNTEELQASVGLILQNREHLNIKGFCTHLAGAESISNYVRIQKQLKKYNNLYSYLIANNIIPKYKHVANSAAAFVYPRSRMDLVRIGIMQYGFWSSTETFIHYTSKKKDKSDPLERILGWQSKIMSIKEVKAGEFIGYGISYLAQKKTRTALIPVGYSLGYNRSLSNKGRVLIRGHRCGVIGLVNMNMIIADISNISEARPGDEVVIIGKQGQLEIQVSAFSNISNALNYEVLAHLPSSIKRVVIQ